MATSSKKYGRRTKAIVSLLAMAIVIGILIYIEQIPVLYLLATLSLVVLLLLVAYSDLEAVGRDDHHEVTG